MAAPGGNRQELPEKPVSQFYWHFFGNLSNFRRNAIYISIFDHLQTAVLYRSQEKKYLIFHNLVFCEVI